MRDFMTRCGDFGFSDLESWTRLYFLVYKGCRLEFIEKIGPLTWSAASGAANNVVQLNWEPATYEMKHEIETNMIS